MTSNWRLSARTAAAALGAIMLGCAIATGAAHAADKTFTLKVEDKTIDIGGGMTYAASTYDGTVPGPLIRATQGDEITVHLINKTTSAHGLDTYAAEGLSPEVFSGDPGKEVQYKFRADTPGVFAYHCSAIPVLRHVADGMYGMTIVDPKDGWPNGKAHEIMLVQGEFYGAPDNKGFIAGSSKKMIDARPDFVVFNGKFDAYSVEHPIEVKVGEPIRIFFLNAGPNMISVFHVTGVIFATVYKGGSPKNLFRDIASLEVGPGTGAVFEFKLSRPGDYQFSDQSLAHPYKGAIGVIRAK